MINPIFTNPIFQEILTTRAMLKRAAKAYKKHVKELSPSILRQLEARQLALKYVANVTYGQSWIPCVVFSRLLLILLTPSRA